jgi:hypothetical protein
MPVPFGFSVGDFLVVTDLTWRVVQALRETSAAVPEVRSLLEILNSFHRVISICQTLAFDWNQLQDGQITISERSVENGINHQLRLCREKLEQLAKTIEPYTRACMKQKGTRTTRDKMTKVKWIFKKEEAENLQQDLGTHVQALEAFTSALGV